MATLTVLATLPDSGLSYSISTTYDAETCQSLLQLTDTSEASISRAFEILSHASRTTDANSMLSDYAAHISMP